MIRSIRAIVRRLVGPREGTPAISSDYRVLPKHSAVKRDGWQAADVAARQHRAFSDLLDAAREGSPRRDFVVAAEAIRRTGLTDPSLLEVGCGSGYYSEALQVLLGGPIRYVGLDYSVEMVSLARRSFASEVFVAADAARLPFPNGRFDIVMSGTSLMHIPEYERAIAESVRVCREWCVFHTVPVMAGRETTFLEKRAYGEPVVEVIFNRFALERIFEERGLRIIETAESIPYDVSAVMEEPTWTLTYLCQKH